MAISVEAFSVFLDNWDISAGFGDGCFEGFNSLPVTTLDLLFVSLFSPDESLESILTGVGCRISGGFGDGISGGFEPPSISSSTFALLGEPSLSGLDFAVLLNFDLAIAELIVDRSLAFPTEPFFGKTVVPLFTDLVLELLLGCLDDFDAVSGFKASFSTLFLAFADACDVSFAGPDARAADTFFG